MVLRVGVLTIDKYRLSMLVDLESQIRNVGRLGWPETPGFPAFWGRFRRGSAEPSSLLMSLRRGASPVGERRILRRPVPRTGFHSPPLHRSPYFQAFPPQMAARARLALATIACPFDVTFRVWWGCIHPIKHACNCSFSHAFLICTKHPKSARENHGKTADRQSIAGPKTSYRLRACLDR